MFRAECSHKAKHPVSILPRQVTQAAGDIITAVNGQPMEQETLVNYVGTAGIGDTLTLSIYRQGETMELTISIGEQIQSALAHEETAETGSIDPYAPERNALRRLPGEQMTVKRWKQPGKPLGLSGCML